jgi:dihydroorotase
VERALEAGRLAEVPVMIDFGIFRPERPFERLVLEKLRPGDMYTHMFHPMVPFFDTAGRLLPYLRQARNRGVKFDLGHGGGSFVWSQALPAVRQGWLPDSLSSDLHTGSMNTGMKDMTNVISKFLSMGVAIDKAVEMSTWIPAKNIRRPELGNLDVGAVADVAAVSVHSGSFGFLDVSNTVWKGEQKLQCDLTVRAGQVVWDLDGRAARAAVEGGR